MHKSLKRFELKFLRVNKKGDTQTQSLLNNIKFRSYETLLGDVQIITKSLAFIKKCKIW